MLPRRGEGREGKRKRAILALAQAPYPGEPVVWVTVQRWMDVVMDGRL